MTFNNSYPRGLEGYTKLLQETMTGENYAPEAFKAQILVWAFNEIMFNLGHYYDMVENPKNVDYADICSEIGVPDYQDNGLIKKAIDEALRAAQFVYRG